MTWISCRRFSVRGLARELAVIAFIISWTTRPGNSPFALHRKIQQSAASLEKTIALRKCDGINVRTMAVRGEERSMVGQSDEDRVRALYAQLMDGWNRGSGGAFAAPFAEQCDFIAFDGTRFRGRDEIARFHDPLFKTHVKATRLVGDVTDISFLGPDVALMHAKGGTVPRGHLRPAPERDAIQTLVATRCDGEWRLVAFQNTRVRPIGRNARGTLLWLVSDWMWKWCLPKSDIP